MFNSNKPEFINNIENLCSSPNIKKNWINLYHNINNNNNNNNDNINIINYISNIINQQNVNEIILDIIDFIINFGNENIKNEMNKNEFVNKIINLLHNSHSFSQNFQKKLIYLIQIWANKFNNFYNAYCFLKNKGIIFPPLNYIIKTYDNFINDNEIINFNFINNENNNNNNNFINPFKDFIEKI